ncbi:hypothetical protein BDR04DRAFT_995278, partial [Suillus decipiens]
HKETLYINYARLSYAQKDNYEVEIIKMCANKQCVVHDNSRAVQHDMQATFAAMDQECLALKMEAFVVSGLDIPTMLKVRKSLNQLVSECWTLIQDELGEYNLYHGVFIITVDANFILHENKLTNHMKMNYKNYKHAIVEHYGVELKG